MGTMFTDDFTGKPITDEIKRVTIIFPDEEEPRVLDLSEESLEKLKAAIDSGLETAGNSDSALSEDDVRRIVAEEKGTPATGVFDPSEIFTKVGSYFLQTGNPQPGSNKAANDILDALVKNIPWDQLKKK